MDNFHEIDLITKYCKKNRLKYLSTIATIDTHIAIIFAKVTKHHHLNIKRIK